MKSRSPRKTNIDGEVLLLGNPHKVEVCEEKIKVGKGEEAENRKKQRESVTVNKLTMQEKSLQNNQQIFD
jgi:hypothetical protein